VLTTVRQLRLSCHIKFNIMPQQNPTWVTSGFHSELAENRALLGHYAASSGNSLPTFRDNLSGPIFRNQEYFWLWYFWLLNMGPISFTETSVRNCRYLLRNDPEERSSQHPVCMPVFSPSCHINHPHYPKWFSHLLISGGGSNFVNICGNQIYILTLNPLMWRIWWVPNNASRWKMGFN